MDILDTLLKDLNAARIHEYLLMSGITIFYYDYLLTFSAEVSHIWPQRISWNIFLFYSNRYIAFFTKIISPALLFSDLRHSKVRRHCSSLMRLHEALLFLNQVAIAGILATRTVALYNNSRTVIFGILACGLVMVGVTSWSLVGANKEYPNGRVVCQFLVSDKAAHYFAIVWEASALFDIIIFVLTLTRTLKLRKIHNMPNSPTREGLLDILLRDGAFYFAIMALTNLTNILTFYLTIPTARGLFSTPAIGIASTLCSRLVLNLYEAATPDNTGSYSYSEPTTTASGILTTRIELGTYIDDNHIELSPIGGSNAPSPPRTSNMLLHNP